MRNYGKIWENIYIYIYILISMYNIDSDSMFFLFVFFEWSMDFPYLYHIYIYNMPHVDDLLSESDMNGYSSGNRCRWFLSFFSDTPRCLAIACEICESQNGRLKPLKLVSNPPDIFWGYNA